MGCFKKKFLTAKDILQIPIEEPVEWEPDYKSIDEILEGFLYEVVERRKAGCCGIICKYKFSRS